MAFMISGDMIINIADDHSDPQTYQRQSYGWWWWQHDVTPFFGIYRLNTEVEADSSRYGLYHTIPSLPTGAFETGYSDDCAL